MNLTVIPGAKIGVKQKTRAAVTISMPKDMAEEYEKRAKRLAKNKSVLFRETFLAYKRQNLKEEF